MDDELSASQILELGKDLVSLKSDLEGLLHITESSARPVQLKENAGRLSRMDEMHNQSILLANRNITKNRIKQIIAAQSRVAENNFGLCTVCDETISYNRLKAYPEAAMCLKCQSAAETV